nr:putative UDP protein [Annona squamosa]
MNWVAGSSKISWQPAMTANTTDSRYWLNWRVALCSIWTLLSVVVSAVLIWKNEGFGTSSDDSEDAQQRRAGFVRNEECWRPCLKEIHPAWLLIFRIVAFCVLVPLLVVYAVVDGSSIFHYYTQWTFTLVTIYFGIGIILSIYGCYQFLNKVVGHGDEDIRPDGELGMHAGPANGRDANRSYEMKNSAPSEEQSTWQSAGIWGYAFQIIYQLLIVMHSMNALFLLGDAALNCLRFPWFRISYFLLWTAIYVIVQWIIHASVSLWWPYPFLDLSSPYAPLWYVRTTLLQYAILLFFSPSFLLR